MVGGQACGVTDGRGQMGGPIGQAATWLSVGVLLKNGSPRPTTSLTFGASSSRSTMTTGRSSISTKPRPPIALSLKRSGTGRPPHGRTCAEYLARYVGTPPQDVQFTYGEHGKPMLAEHDEPCFNLSHSESKGLAAVSRRARIGVDLEFAREGRKFTDIADRFFSQAESAELRALPPEARPAAFYRAWTRKEAYLKAWGTGLSFASNRFTLDYIGEGPGSLLATEMPEDDTSRWHFRDLELGPAYTGAICVEGPDCPIRWWAI